MAVLLLDAAGQVRLASAAARAWWGDDQLTGKHFAALFVFEIVSHDPDFLAAQWEALRDSARQGEIQLEAAPAAGEPIAVTARLEPITDGTGGYLVTLRRAESAPAPTASTSPLVSGLTLLAEKSPAGFFDLHFAASSIRYTPAWKRLLGYTDAELPDTYETWLELLHPEDSAAAPDQVRKKNAAPGALPFSVEFRMRHREGRWVWIQSTGLQVVGADGKLERVVGFHLDITERKESEEASFTNDERLQTLSGAGPLGAFEFDFHQQTGWISPAWVQLVGYEEDELPATAGAETFAGLLPPDEAAGGLPAWFSTRGTPGATTLLEAVRLRHKDGRWLPVLLGAHRQFSRKRELYRVVGFCCALPENLAAASPGGAALPPALLAETFATLAEAVLVTDARGGVLFLNPTAARLLQVREESALGQPAVELFRLVNRLNGQPATDDACEMALSADGPLPLLNQHALAREGAAPLPIVWTARAAFDNAGKPGGVVIVFRDPEEMNLTPEELVKANRFESLGLLAGGIAHDFNNLLTTILGGVSLAKDNHDSSGLDDSEKACLAAKALTRQLLAVAKGSTGARSVVAPGEIVRDAVRVASAGADVEVAVEVADTVPPVQVDRTQILQVFQNLIVNAIQAMPPVPHRGRVTLRAAAVNLAEGQMPPLSGGAYVQFEVRDNGSGIKPEHLERIWDPFFTTKKHGTGLGLATVLSVVRKHGGQIGVVSELGVGTAFTVFLPVADKPVEVQARRAPSLRFGTGRVLFMDDDPKISALTANMLESLEYKYDLARDGAEAIKLYKSYFNIGRPYDAVIMDITVIGGMGGEEAFHALRELDPEVRAIVSSGYDNEEMVQRFLNLGFCGYLTKPYRVTDLGKVLKAVLG
ncbi:MAG: PAS domain-containing protein [Opitutae bacterium]|nr:PAS domain-containing protein [Opitutae bacterium]